MKNLILSALVASFVFAVGTMAFSQNDANTNVPMLSTFKKGQRVRITRAGSSGYNVDILNDEYVKNFKDADPNYVPVTILNIGADYIVLDAGKDVKQKVAAHAIDMITELPDGK